MARRERTADDSSLFSREEQVIGECQALLDGLAADTDVALRTGFEKLLDSYTKLQRRVARLVKLSDRQQGELRHLNELKDRYLHELELLSLTDGLTGIANRRRFDAFLDAEWVREQRTGQPLSLILMDIDHFKNYNDTYGHAAGDSCLIKVSEAIRRAVMRPADLVVRYGGEEFACVLPETDNPGAMDVAIRILCGVLSLGIPHANSSAANVVTLSLGVATIVPAADTPPKRLIEASDALLYEAKNSGRNRVRGMKPA